MLNKIYCLFRRLITKKEEQNQYSGGLWPRLIRDTSADLIKGFSGKIAELGCGEGLFLRKILDNNPSAEIYGIDSWKYILDTAQEKLKNYPNIRFILSDAKSTAIENSKLDYVFCLNTILNLGSIENIKLLFSETNRILKKDGHFIFDIRNAFNPIINLQYKFVKFYDPGCKVPLHAYKIKVIEKLLNESGFKVTNKISIGFPKNYFAPAIIFIANKL